MPEQELESIRQEIADVDRDIFKLIKKRLNLSLRVGEIKRRLKLSVKDYRIEKIVMERNREYARSLNLYEELSDQLSRMLIYFSVQIQDELLTKISDKTERDSKNLLIIGGFGKMGQWFAKFFHSFNYQIHIFDNSDIDSSQIGFPFQRITKLDQEAIQKDIIIIATPIEYCAQYINQLIDLKCQALVFDICSLKSPFLEELMQAAESGLKICSIHPMFGPDVQVLSGRNIIVCDVGHVQGFLETQKLFIDTTASLVSLPLVEHDHLMSIVLGLSHLINILFAQTLKKSNFNFSLLNKVASTTFQSQLEVTRPIVNENVELYFQIQSYNKFSKKIYDLLRRELKVLIGNIENKRQDLFVQELQSSQKYLEQE